MKLLTVQSGTVILNAHNGFFVFAIFETGNVDAAFSVHGICCILKKVIDDFIKMYSVTKQCFRIINVRKNADVRI